MKTDFTKSWGRHFCLPDLQLGFAAIIAMSSIASLHAADLRIVLVQNAKPSRVEVRGVSESQLKAAAKLTAGQWAAKLRITVVPAKSANSDVPAMLGEIRIEKTAIVFRPRFPLVPGLNYRAEFHPGGKQPPITQDFALPAAKPAKPAEIVQVYPTASTLPENLLKFYIHFSAPMSRGEAYDRIALYDSNGKKIADPFLELGEELWDPAGRRFTLFFDPGRIKRGLKPRDDVGPVLEEGNSYVLVIEKKWQSAAGVPLKASFRKPFKVGPPDDRQPSPKRWKLQPPAVGTQQPLTVTFDEALDHAMLHRVLIVIDATGRELLGRVAVDKHETRWRFTPQRDWTAGGYQLRAATNLEDRSGNSIGRPFEVDVTRKNSKRIKEKTTAVPFTIKSGK